MVFLAGVTDEKVSVVCAVSKDLVARGIKAGDVIKAVGAKGGGKPARATGGGLTVDRIEDALAKVASAMEDRLGSS